MEAASRRQDYRPGPRRDGTGPAGALRLPLRPSAGARRRWRRRRLSSCASLSYLPYSYYLALPYLSAGGDFG